MRVALMKESNPMLFKSIITAFCFISLSLCVGCRDDRTKPEFRLTYSVFFPPSHINAQLAKAWAEDIEKATNHRVRIIIFAGSTLTKANQCYQGVVDGISDIGMSCFAYTPGRFPLLEALDLPVGYPDGITATRTTNAIVNQFQPKELADTHLLYLHAHGPGVLASTYPVTKLSDLANFKVRGTGVTARIIKSLGGQAIGMSQPETYDALSKGVVDGTLCPIETLKGWRQGECIDYILRTPSLGYTTTMFVTMNHDTWDRLPVDIQAIFTQVSTKYIDLHGQGWDQAGADGEAFTRNLNCTFNTLSPEESQRWDRAIEPIFTDYIQRASTKGVPAQAFLDALRIQLKEMSTQEESSCSEQ